LCSIGIAGVVRCFDRRATGFEVWNSTARIAFETGLLIKVGAVDSLKSPKLVNFDSRAVVTIIADHSSFSLWTIDAVSP
jgi:hypothetical protein